jgi:anti-sigma B factor antagonist
VTGTGGTPGAERPDVLSVDVQRGQDASSVQLRGDLDLSSVPQFEQALLRVLETAPARLTLDLQGLSFLDSCGLRAILTTQRDCEQAGCALTLIAGEQAKRLFDLTGVSETLPLADPSATKRQASA